MGCPSTNTTDYALGGGTISQFNMVGHLKVAYQNACKGSENTNTFLQWCWEKKVDIAFIGEPWRSGDIKSSSFKDGMQLHDAYLLGAGDKQKDMVVGYWRKNIAEDVEVLTAGKKEIWIAVRGVKIEGVYRKGEEGVADIQEWIRTIDTVARNGERVALGDWNTHHDSWHIKGESNRRGKYLHETMQLNGMGLVQQQKTPKSRRGEQQSRIDLVFAIEKLVTKQPTEEWLTRDHVAILITIKAQTTTKSPTIEKLVSDKVELDALLSGLEKVGREMQETWYTSLIGDTPYDKLKHLVAESQRVIKINEKSKRWSDKELSEQVKKVAAPRRGGTGGGSRENNNIRWKKWKGEKVKLKWMIREKKRNCW